MDDIRTFKRTDYSRYVRHREPAPVTAVKKSPASHSSELMTISIRIKLPDYSKWNIYKFVRQYPYITLAAAAVAIMLLILTGDILNWLWHLTHNHGAHK